MPEYTVPKKDLIEFAAEIIKSAYATKQIPQKDFFFFYTIPQAIRLEAQKYVNKGLI